MEEVARLLPASLTQDLPLPLASIRNYRLVFVQDLDTTNRVTTVVQARKTARPKAPRPLMLSQKKKNISPQLLPKMQNAALNYSNLLQRILHASKTALQLHQGQTLLPILRHLAHSSPRLELPEPGLPTTTATWPFLGQEQPPAPRLL